MRQRYHLGKVVTVELELDSSDLAAGYETTHLTQVKFHHLKERAQMAVMVVGRGVLRSGDRHVAINAPEKKGSRHVPTARSRRPVALRFESGSGDTFNLAFMNGREIGYSETDRSLDNVSFGVRIYSTGGIGVYVIQEHRAHVEKIGMNKILKMALECAVTKCEKFYESCWLSGTPVKMIRK